MQDNHLFKALEPLFKVIMLDITDSTNNEAKRIIASGFKEPFLVISREQTAGRGRQGKSFFSPKDSGLYMTIGFPIEKNAKDFLYMTSAAAVAVVRELEALTGVICRIKWVNDIYLEGKKISGILTESVLGENPYIIVGIGINLTTAKFPEDIKDIAGTLSKDISPALAASGITLRLKDYFDKGKASFIDDYRKFSLVLDKEITYIKNGETNFGRATEILDSGALLVVKEDGTKEILDSGEITLRLKNK